MRADVVHSVDRPELAACEARDAAHLPKRRSGSAVPPDQELRLLEAGQQRLVEVRGRRDRGENEDPGDDVHGLGPTDDARQRSSVPAADSAEERRVSPLLRPSGEQQHAQGRRDRQRNQESRAERHHVGDGDRREERARHAVQEEERDDGQGGDQGPVDRDAANLEQRVGQGVVPSTRPIPLHGGDAVAARRCRCRRPLRRSRGRARRRVRRAPSHSSSCRARAARARRSGPTAGSPRARPTRHATTTGRGTGLRAAALHPRSARGGDCRSTCRCRWPAGTATCRTGAPTGRASCCRSRFRLLESRPGHLRRETSRQRASDRGGR